MAKKKLMYAAMVVVGVMLFFTSPQAAMAAEAGTTTGSSSGNIDTNGDLVYDNGTFSGSVTTTAADSLNTSGITATTVGNGTGATTVNGSTVGVTGATVTATGGSGALSVTNGNASLTVTNPQGNTHGIVVTNSQTTITGGVHSSKLTLNDNGATFSNSSSGGPIQVHGVADGTDDYDAVNYRQLEEAYSGIASVAALAAIPSPAAGKKFSIGMGYGYFKDQNALAMGIKAAVADNVILTGGIGYGRTPTASAGVGYSW